MLLRVYEVTCRCRRALQPINRLMKTAPGLKPLRLMFPQG